MKSSKVDTLEKDSNTMVDPIILKYVYKETSDMTRHIVSVSLLWFITDKFRRGHKKSEKDVSLGPINTLFYDMNKMSVHFITL